MPIRILSDQLASQIAAGEVVERPSAVVKELLENALDAGATSIQVDVRNGGRQLIQVADDGQGIAADEIETAFQRHATSKLATAEELNAIATLGFRGEALAAIAAVSRLTAVSRATDAGAGARLLLEGGHIAQRETVGAPPGTVIAVENLFYNVPARLQFLKSVTTEKRLIDELISRYALAYPQVRLRLAHDGRVTFQSSGNGNLPDVLAAVYGVETARELLPVDAQGSEGAEERARTVNSQQSTANSQLSPHHPITISGYVAPPSRHWSNRSQVTLFVNGRWVRDQQLTYAVVQAYHTLLPGGRYPLALLFISLPPQQVDVNVHPAKVEVRFRDSRAVFSAVQRAVRQTVLAHTPVRSFDHFESLTPAQWRGSLGQNAFSRRDAPEPEQESLGLHWQPGTTGSWSETTAVAGNETEPTAVNGEQQRPAAESGAARLPLMRVVGQVGATFIISEGPDGLFLIDQHAAHERILYEQFLAEWGRDGVMSQGLVTGTAVQLTPAQATLLNDHLALLTRLGFQLEPFGPNTFMVRAIPALLSRLDPARALHEVIVDLEQDQPPLQDEIEKRVIRRVCKSAAVKAGQTLSTSEMEAMIRQLEACQNPHTCPHGRPTLIHLSVAQLASVFGRT